MKGALIRSVLYENGVNYDGNAEYKLEVERVVDVSSEFALEDLRKFQEYPYALAVDENVYPGMFYDSNKGVIYDRRGERVYPPISIAESIKKINGAIDDITYNVDVSTLELDDLKDYLIRKNKKNLEDYLYENPLVVDGKAYTVTSDKQNQLTGMLNAYNYAKAIGMNIDLTWNESGEECKPYTFEQLVGLYLQMLAYVKPIVTYQQHAEIEIRNAETVEEALAVDITFRGLYPPVEEEETTTDNTESGEQIDGGEGSDKLEPVASEE